MNEIRPRIDRLLAQYRLATSKVRDEREALALARDKLAVAQESQQLVQHVAELIQNNAHKSLASVVTRCLEVVYGDKAYEFRIEFERKRGRTEARMAFYRDGNRVDPISEAGGGPVEIAGFALRTACLCLQRPRPRRLLCLDEPFRSIQGDLRERVAELLMTLAKEMDIQMVIVTHDSQFRIGKVIEIG
jgi:DNA repair exonuclease SbcCD ATPase subunit